MNRLHVLFIVCILSTGCGNQCTEIAYRNGLFIDILIEEPPNAEFFTFEGFLDGESINLTTSATTTLRTFSTDATSETFQMGISLSDREIYEIYISRKDHLAEARPNNVTLRILADNIQIGNIILEDISYIFSEPNGEGCGFAAQARVQLNQNL